MLRKMHQKETGLERLRGLKTTLCTHLLTNLKHMEGKSASCCQVGQMALTSVVVFDFFICCGEDGHKKKARNEFRSEERVEGANAEGKSVKVFECSGSYRIKWVWSTL